MGSVKESYLAWAYVDTTATSGKVPLALQYNMLPGVAYELRYYLNDGWTLAATSAPFYVTK